ncbi:MAG: hypothetical protein ACYTGG_04445 [Planctomycetota bacterium]|jgi:hypothetical protein
MNDLVLISKAIGIAHDVRHVGPCLSSGRSTFEMAEGRSHHLEGPAVIGSYSDHPALQSY